MAFVVGQGVISLLGRCRGSKVSGRGVISPRYMQLAWSIRAGPKVLLSPKLHDSPKAFEIVVFFSRLKRLLQFIYIGSS